MKNITFLSIALIFAFSGCKKETQLTESSQTFTVNTTDWVWDPSGNDYYYNITDGRITQDVINNGLATVYFVGSTSNVEYIEALPHSYPSGVDYIDYFNVGFDNIIAYGFTNGTPPNTLQFKVVVISD